MATRCCWAADNSAGYLRACSFSPDAVEQLFGPLQLPRHAPPSTFFLRQTQVLDDLQMRKQFKMWNTMPTGAQFRQIGPGIVDL